MATPKIILPSIFFFFFFDAGLNAQPSYITFPSDIDWVTRSSEHFDVLYRKGNSPLAERALNAAERAHSLLDPLFPPGPQRTWMVIAEFSDSTNGYALPFPYPHMVIFAAPPGMTSALSSLDDWLSSVILHEYVHIRHIYPASGLWSWLRTLFGTIIAPNGLMPSHFHEGLAVLLETEMSHGGRGRSSHFEMIKRMAVEEEVWGTDRFTTFDRMDGTVSLWPQGESAYFFGYHFYKELWQQKGPKGIYRLTESYSDNWPYLFFDGPLTEVYGKTYDNLWKDTFQKTARETQKEIENIRKNGLTHLNMLTQTRQKKWDVTFSPTGQEIAYRKWDPEEGHRLEILTVESSCEKKLEITDTHGEGLCWGILDGNDYLYLITDSSVHPYTTTSLKAYDLKKEQEVSLTLDGEDASHLHRLGCSADLKTLLIYQESGGIGKVIEYRRSNGFSYRSVRNWPIPDGSYVTSLLLGSPTWLGLRTGMQTTLYRWDAEGDPKPIASIPAHVYQFRAGEHPNAFFALSDFSGRDEVWEFRPSTQEMSKRVSLLGGANSFDFRHASFALSDYRHGGYDIATAQLSKDGVTNKIPAPQHTEKPPPSPIKMGTEEGYQAWSTLYPHAWIPSIYIVPNGVQFGAWVPGFDISQKHSYNITLGYDTRGLPFADVDYSYRFGSNIFLELDAFYLPSYIYSFNDFFQRWGSVVGIGAKFSPVSVQLNFVFKRVETFLGNPSKQSVGLNLAANCKLWFKKHPLSVTPLRGTSFSASYSYYPTFLGSDDAYYVTSASVEQYLEAPWWKEHVWYANLKFGYTQGTVLYNSYFEAGGELLFYQTRGTFLNRGFLPGTFLARRILNFSLEYRFPIANIERGMALMPFKIQNLYASLVSDTTTFDLGTQSSFSQDLLNVFYTSAGLELTSHWLFSYYLPAKFRLGGYHGFGPFGEILYVTAGLEASL